MEHKKGLNRVASHSRKKIADKVALECVTNLFLKLAHLPKLFGWVNVRIYSFPCSGQEPNRVKLDSSDISSPYPPH